MRRVALAAHYRPVDSGSNGPSSLTFIAQPSEVLFDTTAMPLTKLYIQLHRPRLDCGRLLSRRTVVSPIISTALRFRVRSKEPAMRAKGCDVEMLGHKSTMQASV